MPQLQFFDMSVSVRYWDLAYFYELIISSTKIEAVQRERIFFPVAFRFIFFRVYIFSQKNIQEIQNPFSIIKGDSQYSWTEKVSATNLSQI